MVYVSEERWSGVFSRGKLLVLEQSNRICAWELKRFGKDESCSSFRHVSHDRRSKLRFDAASFLSCCR